MLRGPLLLISLQLLHHASSQDTLVDYSIFGSSPRKDLAFPELVAYDKYRQDTHYVTTSDGYILHLFHIYPNEKCVDIKKIPVLFMPGLYLNGDDGIIPGPGIATCYLLADECYDVWVGNVRGCKFGRNHTQLNPDTDMKFWDFSFDEMALYDLPAIIELVLKESGQSQIYYVGHSQGVTIAIILCAKRAAYNLIIKFLVGLSTATWMTHTRLLTITAQAILSPATALNMNGEIFKFGGATQRLADFACGTSNVSYPYCTAAIFALFGFNNFTISQETIAVAVGHEPSGSSRKNFLRWGHIYIHGFSEYDWGPTGNLIKYGSITPPLYVLSNVTANSIFVASHNDYVCDPRDLDTLMAHLVNCVNCSKCILSYKWFSHIDYIYSDLIPTVTMPIILAAFDRGERICT